MDFETRCFVFSARCAAVATTSGYGVVPLADSRSKQIILQRSIRIPMLQPWPTLGHGFGGASHKHHLAHPQASRKVRASSRTRKERKDTRTNYTRESHPDDVHGNLPQEHVSPKVTNNDTSSTARVRDQQPKLRTSTAGPACAGSIPMRTKINGNAAPTTAETATMTSDAIAIASAAVGSSLRSQTRKNATTASTTPRLSPSFASVNNSRRWVDGFTVPVASPRIT